MTNLLLLCLLNLSRAADITSNGVPSLFYSREIYPKHRVRIEFEFPQCPLDSRLLNIERRDLDVALDSAENGQKTKVRYVYLTGRLSGMHKECPSKNLKTTLQYEIEKDPKRITHLFITLESPAKVISLRNDPS